MAVLACTLLLLILGAAAPAPLATDWYGDHALPVGGLDDPANPYREQYGPLDRWAWEHYVPHDEVQCRDVAANRASSPMLPPRWGEERELRIWVQVDGKGWPKPVMPERDTQAAAAPLPWDPEPGQTVREYFAAQATKRKGWATTVQPVRLHYTAMATASAELTDAYHLHIHERQARTTPPIPAWLGENPPLLTVFLPDGTIFTHGALGQRYQPRPGQPAMPSSFGDPWHLYARDGKRLGTYPSKASWGGGWLTVMHPELKPPPGSDLVPGDYQNMYVLRRRPPTAPLASATSLDYDDYELVSAYDWKGKPLDLDGPMPVAEPGYGMQHGPDSLATIYGVQLRLGLTSRDTTSPYAGTADGPVLATPPQPRPLPVLAQNYGATGEMVPVRALNDPANPFRGQYGEWDRWVFDHLGTTNPQANRALNEQMQQWHKDVQAALKAGQPAPPEPLGGYTPPAEDTWRYVDVRVTEDGWILPLAEQERYEARMRFIRDRRLLRMMPAEYPYTAQAGGDMPPDAYAAYLAYRKQAKLAETALRVPHVPDWLNASLPQYVALPDGTWIVLGSPEVAGVLLDPSASVGERPFANRIWYRIDATGKLLTSVAADKSNPVGWLALTFPGAARIKSEAEAAGRGVRIDDGYLLVFDGPLTVPVKPGESARKQADQPPALVAAYDWDGAPLDISRPLTREHGYGIGFTWEDLRSR